MSETDKTAPVAEVNGMDLGNEQLALAIEHHLRAVAIGLVATNPQIRQDIMWEAIASAMGRVLSGATISADIKASLDARGKFGDIVNRSIRKAYPAINAANVAAANTNSNKSIILPH